MSSFGSGSTTTAGASITLRNYTGTDGNQAGTDGLVPGPGIAQQGYVLGASGDWVLTIKAIDDLNESSTRIATTDFVQTLIGQAQLGGGNANLSALGDVSFANLATGQFLQYNNNGDNNWSNITLTLGTISDVDLAGLQDGNALVYSAAANGGNGGWIPGEGGGGGAATLNGLGDVTINGGAENHFLVRNDAGQYVNRTISSADLSNTADLILRDGTVAFTGDVNVIDHDLSVGTITIKDNANTFIIKSQDGASPNYITFNTTNALELITFEKNTAFNQRVDFANTVVINEAGNGVDFRVETGTKTHAIFTSGTNDRVGIFQDNPTVALDVVGDTKIDGGLELTGNITAANLGTASANDAGDFLASTASIGALSDVDLTGVGANEGDGRVLIWEQDENNGNGGFITGVPASTYTDENARNASGTALANSQNHTGISFVNNDNANTIDATVDITGFSVRDLSDVSNDALVNGKILKVVNNVLTQADETDTNTQLSDEQVQDIVGAMVDGGTETDITVSYDDGTAKLNFVVDNTIARLDDPDFTGTPTAPNPLNLAVDNTQIATTAFVHDLIDSDINALNLGTASTSATGDFLSSTTASIGDLSDVDLGNDGLVVGKIGQVLKVIADGNGGHEFALADETGASQEEIEDIVGAMVAGNTETGITVTYVDDDANAGKLNFEVGGLADAQIAGGAAISVDKLASKAITLGSSTLNLGGNAVTSIAGMTGIDFTNADATIGATMTTTNGGANSTTLTLGGVGSTIAIAGTLTVNAPDNATDATTKDYVDTQVGTKQDSNANLTSLSGLNIVNGSMIIGDDNNSFEILTIQLGVENFLKSSGRIASLSDITFDDDELTNANHFIVSTGAGGFQNTTISTANLSNSANVVLNNADATFGAHAYDFTASTVTVNAPANGADATTKTYVDTQVATKQAADASLNDITGIVDGDLLLGDGDNSFEKVNLTAGAESILKGSGSVGTLSDITLEAGAVGNVLRVSAVGNVGGVDNVPTAFVNTDLSSGDLSDTANISLLNANQTLSGDKTFTGGVDLTGATTTAETVANNNVEGNSTRVATTAFVKTVLAQVGGVSDLDDLTDVNLGVKVVEVDGQNVNDGVALANAQILVYDADGGNNDTTFKNVSLSGDVAITNAGVSTIQDDAITLAKIDIISDDAITNAKLANEYVTFSDGANADNLSLGQTATFNAVANETTVDVAADAGAGVAITIGLPDDVTIGRDLSVTRNLEITGNLTVNGTTTTVSTQQLSIEDPVSVLNANDAQADVGYFFTNPGASGDQIFIFDNTDQIFKMAQVPNGADGEDSDFNPTVYSGLKIGALTATTGTFSSLLNADGGIEIDNGGNKFTVSNAGAVVSVGGITDTTTASAFATGTTIGDLTLASGSITDANGSIDFGDENLSTSGNLTINTDKFVVTGATGNLAINTNKFTVAGATGNTLVAGTLEVTLGATFTAGLSANDQNITNVADIALDSISADGDAIAIVLDDNIENALVIREGGNNYITVDTTDDAELITFEKNVVFNGTTNISANFDQAITINDSGAAVDFRVEGDTQTHLLFTDGSNDRVGINTDTPSSQLHVVGATTFAGVLTQSGGNAVFNNGEADFDFRVAGNNQSNLFFVDASTDRVGVRTNTPAKILDVVGDVGISTTLDVTGKTTLAGSLDLTTGSSAGIRFRTNIADGGANANQTLIQVNKGGAGPVYKSIKWVAATDLFEVESGLKSTGNFTVGADLATINATTGVTSIKGATTINNAGGTSDLIVQNNGADVLNVDVSAGLTTITGIATVSSQLKTDDLRGLTAGTGNFHIRLEDNIANALEILDATNALSFMTFTTTDDSESITLAQDSIFKKAISIENTNTNGLFFNSNRSAEVSEDATLITVEGGSNKNDVVLAWDTSDNAINLNANSQVHLQGLAGSNALTIGGALVADATITMTTAGAITLDGTLDSPTINTDKITDKTGDGLVVELADALNGNALLVSDAGGSNYLTVNTSTEKITLHKGTTVSNTLAVSMQTTLGGILNLKFDAASPLIKANSDRTAENAEADATLIEVERGILNNAKFKWDETSDCFEFDAILSAEGNFQVGTDAQNPTATINSATGNLSTDGTISATSSITTASVLNFSTASQGAILFNSDLGNGVAPANDDDFGLTVNRGNTTDAKLYWDESDTSWKFETGNVQAQNKLVIDSAEVNKIEIEAGSITTANDTGINFGSDNLETTGSITSATPALNTNSTVVATTAFVKGQKLGDLDQVDTTGFDTTGQVLIYDTTLNGGEGGFKEGSAVYASENARDDVGAALNGGTHTGATTITFTNDDANDVINLALGITTEDLTDVSTDQATNNQVLRFTTAEGANQNKYVPTTLGTAADVDTGLSNGNVPTLSTHFHSTKTNETADLVITGRYIESIDYGLVNEAYDANTDWALDFGSVTDTGISSWEDYGQLVV